MKNITKSISFAAIFLIFTNITAGAVSEYADIYGKTIASVNKVYEVTDSLLLDCKDIENISVTAEILLENQTVFNNTTQNFMYFKYDGSNGYALKINDARSSVSIYKVTNGTHKWFKTAGSKLLEPDEPLRIKIDMYGSDFRIYIANKSYSYFQKPSITFSDTSFTGGDILFEKPAEYEKMTINSVYVRELSSLGKPLEKDSQTLVNEYKNPYSLWEDCKNHPFGGAIRCLASKGIVSGKFENKFCPDVGIQIKELLKIAVKLQNIKVTENERNWAEPYIYAAIKSGIISEGQFSDFSANITKSQAAEILGIPENYKSDNSLLTRGEACLMAASLIDDFYKGDYISDENTVYVSFAECERAFSNPLKGFRGSADVSNYEFETLVHHNIPWNSIETNASDGVEKITSYCNKLWAGYPEKNIKAIPRVILQFNDQYYWPDDMTELDFTSSAFQSRLSSLIKKLGAAWDNDPRVAFVQIGIIGNWGEMQSPYPTAAVRRILYDEFKSAFKNKIVQTNFLLKNTVASDYSFGYFWDSFGHRDNLGILDGCASFNWQTAPLGGESAFDWGETLGENPDDALLNYSDKYKELIRYSHSTYLGWISRYTRDDDKIKEKAEILQKTMGYRFVITDAKYTASAKSGDAASLGFKVINTGSAPMYCNWPLQISLLDSETHLPVWHENISADINLWLPSTDFSEEISYTTSVDFTVPSIESGRYILALSIAEPGGSFPTLRFANENYYSGGYTPLGIFAVNTENTNPYITEGFDDLQSDRLKY